MGTTMLAIRSQGGIARQKRHNIQTVQRRPEYLRASVPDEDAQIGGDAFVTLEADPYWKEMPIKAPKPAPIARPAVA